MAGRAPHHARRRLRSVRLRRRRAAATAVRSPPLRAVLATADTQAGGRVADLYPSLAAAYPDLMLTAADPAAGGRAGRGLPGPAARGVAGSGAGAAQTGRARSWTWPPTSGSGTRRSTRGGTAVEHRCPDLLAEAVTGIPELFRDRPARRHPDRGGGLLSDCGGAGPGAPGPGRHDRRPGRGCRRGQRGVRGGPGAPSPHPLQHRGRGLHRLRAARPPAHARRSSRPSGAQVIFTPHLAPMNRGILATCYARPAPDAVAGPDPLAALRRLLRRRSLRDRATSVHRRRRPPWDRTAPT